jgi:hypothetical protein
MRMHQWTPRDVALALALLGVGLLLALPNGAGAKPSRDTWPPTARAAAGTAAQRWVADVPAAARLGAEPAGRCRRVDGRNAACPVAIALLANNRAGRQPWRCAATVMVTRTNGRVAARRMGSGCTPFPKPAAMPDPRAALGSAHALGAVGDIACLPGSDGRVTCVVTYRGAGGARCVGAASVPLGRFASAVALGEPLCAQIKRSA